MYDLFAKHGPVLSISLREGRGAGSKFAFVQFERVIHAMIARQATQDTIVHGHAIKVSYSQSTRDMQLWLSSFHGFAEELKEEDVRTLMAEFGEVRFVHILPAPHGAVVGYNTTMHSSKAVEKLHGRPHTGGGIDSDMLLLEWTDVPQELRGTYPPLDGEIKPMARPSDGPQTERPGRELSRERELSRSSRKSRERAGASMDRDREREEREWSRGRDRDRDYRGRELERREHSGFGREYEYGAERRSSPPRRSSRSHSPYSHPHAPVHRGSMLPPPPSDYRDAGRGVHYRDTDRGMRPPAPHYGRGPPEDAAAYGYPPPPVHGYDAPRGHLPPPPPSSSHLPPPGHPYYDGPRYMGQRAPLSASPPPPPPGGPPPPGAVVDYRGRYGSEYPGYDDGGSGLGAAQSKRAYDGDHVPGKRMRMHEGGLGGLTVVWRGRMTVKSTSVAVQMQALGGSMVLLGALPAEGDEVKIVQRMRLDPEQLAATHDKVAAGTDHFCMLAVSASNAESGESGVLETSFVRYLMDKQAAGIVYRGERVLYIMPGPCAFDGGPCAFVGDVLARSAPSASPEALHNKLIVIIT